MHVSMILEGTYPYIVGGVSTWVHHLISEMQDIEFSIVHLYSGKKPEDNNYRVPKNVRRIIRLPVLTNKHHSEFHDILSVIPEADLYHSLSTGFAGWIGTELKRQRDIPLLLTEHGIYWHEIELGADEIECGFKVMKMKRRAMCIGNNWFTWLQFFKHIAKQAYTDADVITTVCEKNRVIEMSISREAKKCRVIPNGVPLVGLSKIAHGQRTQAPAIGLIGRVTPIKDVESFIRACEIVSKELPLARFYVIGPIDQNPDYYLRCQKLAEKLGLENLFFTGNIDVKNYYKNLDLVVLTSVSEGLPFSLLEAMAVEIPVVATKVGGCEELINGADDGLGQAGLLCRVGDVAGIAAAMIQILKEQSLAQKFGQVGRKRIEKYYRLEDMVEKYRSIYYELSTLPEQSMIQVANYI